MALNSVGTPGMPVGFFSAIVFRSSVIWNRGSKIISAPSCTAQFITTVMAKTWNRGSTPSMRFGPSLIWANQRAHCSVLA